jgi:hypothetical protein
LSELVHLRELLTQDDPEALEEAFVETAEGWARWVEEREQGLWIREHTVSTNHIPSLGKRVTQMILGERVSTRLKERPDRPREE